MSQNPKQEPFNIATQAAGKVHDVNTSNFCRKVVDLNGL